MKLWVWVDGKQRALIGYGPGKNAPMAIVVEDDRLSAIELDRVRLTKPLKTKKAKKAKSKSNPANSSNEPQTPDNGNNSVPANSIAVQTQGGTFLTVQKIPDGKGGFGELRKTEFKPNLKGKSL